MKKFLLFMVCLFTWTMGSAEVADKKISFNNLPQTAKKFVKQHFPRHKVVSVEMDDDRTYEVRLSGNIQIDFNHNGRWTEIESDKRGIPQSALPERVLHKVKAKFGNVKVVEVERDGEEFEVKLADGREMKINRLAKKHQKKSKDNDDDDDDDDDDD